MDAIAEAPDSRPGRRRDFAYERRQDVVGGGMVDGRQPLGGRRHKASDVILARRIKHEEAILPRWTIAFVQVARGAFGSAASTTTRMSVQRSIRPSLVKKTSAPIRIAVARWIASA